MNIKTKILNFSEQMGVAANSCKLIATTAGSRFYTLCFGDEDGFPIPTGLPLIVKVEGESLTLISGDKALNLLGSLSIEE